MKFDYVNKNWMRKASEDELRSTAREMEKEMDRLNWDNSPEFDRIYWLHIELVQTIDSRFPINLPHREHGWNLAKD
ncbi:hypothetical protein [Butyrivibrio sp. AE3004]|uniref:hypothetical protein n=1 Tax=Butyrivibrio sp. AE3004 TaxID=1506994 RepID=UPI000493E60A|nr:hypothetical protein [Butyrivibrio sp. AE3004]